MNVRAMITVVIEEPTHNLDEVIKRQNTSTETQLVLVEFLNKIGEIVKSQSKTVLFKTHQSGLTGYSRRGKGFMFINLHQDNFSTKYWTGNEKITGLAEANWSKSDDKSGSEMITISNLSSMERAVGFAVTAYSIAAAGGKESKPVEQVEVKQWITLESHQPLAPESDSVDYKQITITNQPITRHNEEIDPLSPDRIPLETEIHIMDGANGYSYERLYLPYVKGAKTIKICDPYIRTDHQKRNFRAFCDILSSPLVVPLQLELITNFDPEHEAENRADLNEMKNNLLIHNNIEFKFTINDSIHLRWMETDTGWRILMDRGLDIFHKPEGRYASGILDQTKRTCKETFITYKKKKK